MSAVAVRPLATRADRREFLRLPAKLHARDARWVAPLLLDEARLLDERHPARRYCRTTEAIAWRGGEALGRVQGIVNPRHDASTARFSALECGPDAAGPLLAHVEAWARGLGCRRVTGPMGFSDQDPEGLQVDGFAWPPPIATCVNDETLPALVETCGYRKDVDYVVYRAPVPSEAPPVYRRATGRLLRSGGVELVAPRTRRELAALAPALVDLLAETFVGLHGFVPPDERERAALCRQYVPLLDPRFVKAARHGGRLVGFIVGMPNLAEGFRRARGRLLPLGWWHLWRAARASRQLDLLVGGVAREWRGRGVDALVGGAMLASAHAAGMTALDSHHVLETNTRMRAEYDRLGGAVAKRYRIYARDL